jgi:cysteamine dioxygenase
MFTLAVAADDTGDDLNGVDVAQGQGGLALLKEIDMPRDLKICSVHYGGPPISDK